MRDTGWSWPAAGFVNLISTKTAPWAHQQRAGETRLIKHGSLGIVPENMTPETRSEQSCRKGSGEKFKIIHGRAPTP